MPCSVNDNATKEQYSMHFVELQEELRASLEKHAARPSGAIITFLIETL